MRLDMETITRPTSDDETKGPDGACVQVKMGPMKKYRFREMQAISTWEK